MRTTVLTYMPSGSQIIFMLELPRGASKSMNVCACMPRPRIVVQFTWNVAWALEFLRDPQVILGTDKFGNHWYQHLLASLPLLPILEDMVNHPNYTSHLDIPSVSLCQPSAPRNLKRVSGHFPAPPKYQPSCVAAENHIALSFSGLS